MDDHANDQIKAAYEERRLAEAEVAEAGAAARRARDRLRAALKRLDQVLASAFTPLPLFDGAAGVEAAPGPEPEAKRRREPKADRFEAEMAAYDAQAAAEEKAAAAERSRAVREELTLDQPADEAEAAAPMPVFAVVVKARKGDAETPRYVRAEDMDAAWSWALSRFSPGNIKLVYECDEAAAEGHVIAVDYVSATAATRDNLEATRPETIDGFPAELVGDDPDAVPAWGWRRVETMTTWKLSEGQVERLREAGVWTIRDLARHLRPGRGGPLDEVGFRDDTLHDLRRELRIWLANPETRPEQQDLSSRRLEEANHDGGRPMGDETRRRIQDFSERVLQGTFTPTWGDWCEWTVEVPLANGERVEVRVLHDRPDHVEFHGPVTDAGYRSCFVRDGDRGTPLGEFAAACCRALLTARKVHVAQAEGWRRTPLDQLPGVTGTDAAEWRRSGITRAGDLADYGHMPSCQERPSLALQSRGAESLVAMLAGMSGPAESPAKPKRARKAKAAAGDAA